VASSEPSGKGVTESHYLRTSGLVELLYVVVYVFENVQQSFENSAALLALAPVPVIIITSGPQWTI